MPIPGPQHPPSPCLRRHQCTCNTPDADGNRPLGLWGSDGALPGREEDCGACHPLYTTDKACREADCLCAALCPVNPAFPGVVCSGHGECEAGVCARCSGQPGEYWCGDLCEIEGVSCAKHLCPKVSCPPEAARTRTQ